MQFNKRHGDTEDYGPNWQPISGELFTVLLRCLLCQMQLLYVGSIHRKPSCLWDHSTSLILVEQIFTASR